MIIVTSALAGTGIKASFGQPLLYGDTCGSLIQSTSPTYLGKISSDKILGTLGTYLVQSIDR
jgi:hypothetical protein